HRRTRQWGMVIILSPSQPRANPQDGSVQQVGLLQVLAHAARLGADLVDRLQDGDLLDTEELGPEAYFSRFPDVDATPVEPGANGPRAESVILLLCHDLSPPDCHRHV